MTARPSKGCASMPLRKACAHCATTACAGPHRARSALQRGCACRANSVMEAFRSEALDAAGRTVPGVVQADTPRQARTQLRAQGLLPSAVDLVRARARARPAWG